MHAVLTHLVHGIYERAVCYMRAVFISAQHLQARGIISTRVFICAQHSQGRGIYRRAPAMPPDVEAEIVRLVLRELKETPVVFF